MRRIKTICILFAVIFTLTVALSGCGQPKTIQSPTATVLRPAVTPETTAAVPPADIVTPTPAQTVKPTETPQLTPTPSDTPAPTPAVPVTNTPAPENPTYTLAISCGTILDNMDKLTKGKDILVPENGWILYEEGLSFIEGETVFDVLKRELTDRLIHMEFSTTPLYSAIYIEGIANLYEFDCGELSGWMYRVNGVYPNYSCSEYTLSDGDVIEWLYTCDLGADIGGGNFLE